MQTFQKRTRRLKDLKEYGHIYTKFKNNKIQDKFFRDTYRCRQ